MTRLSNDLNNLSEMLHHTPENIVMYGTQFFGSLIILFAINWQLTLVICVLLVMMVLYTFPFYHKMQKVLKKNRAIMGDVNALVQENLSGIRVVKSFASEKAEIDKFTKENNRHYQRGCGVNFHATVFAVIVTPNVFDTLGAVFKLACANLCLDFFF